MSSCKLCCERQVIRALFAASRQEWQNIRWRCSRIDGECLAKELSKDGHPVSREAVEDIVKNLSMFSLREDSLHVNIKGFVRDFDRQTIAEGLGSEGVQFFPTRQSANRSAYETCREAAFFGYGAFEDQFLKCPVEALGSLIGQPQSVPVTTVLRDLREGFAENDVACDMLGRDQFFNADVSTPEKYVAFQNQLRSSSISGDLADKLSSFFHRRMTIGVRDTLRWSLGARHPRFDWSRAKKHIETAFSHYGRDDFNAPQLVYYTYAPSVDDNEIEETTRLNAVVVDELADQLKNALDEAKLDLSSSVDGFRLACQWILDIHHDYPDFDLECAGLNDAAVHIDFMNHSVHEKVSQNLTGNAVQMRRNTNFRAHFDAYGLTQRCLSRLTASELDLFFDTVKSVIRRYDDKNGFVTEQGILMYRRLPTVLFMLQQRGLAQALEGERVLDSFDLSVMTSLEHASYMRTYGEISEKLLVFFVLTLRHMMMTDHAPDLRPKKLIKDFLVLGLWGTRTPNLLVHLYAPADSDPNTPVSQLARSEVRFIGCEQVEIHALDHLNSNAKAMRFIVAQCLPLIEPSILRNIGTFTMAMDEFTNGAAAPEINAFSIVHYASDILREIGHAGIKGSLEDVVSLTEFLVGASLDHATQKLDEVDRWLKKYRHDA